VIYCRLLVIDECITRFKINSPFITFAHDIYNTHSLFCDVCDVCNCCCEQVSLIVLIEVVLGPLFVWLGGFEAPTKSSIIGGVVIILALAANISLSMRAVWIKEKEREREREKDNNIKQQRQVKQKSEKKGVLHNNSLSVNEYTISNETGGSLVEMYGDEDEDVETGQQETTLLCPTTVTATPSVISCPANLVQQSIPFELLVEI
jgi:hypothetical protein